MNKEKIKKIFGVQRLVKTGLFGAFIIIIAFIGILWFARPKTSEVEKRELTKFPKLTIAGLWDGSFFSDVDTWYADTYPLREGLISSYHSLQSHYGIRSTQIIAAQPEEDDEESKDIADITGQDEPQTAADPDEGLEEGRGDIDAQAEPVGGIYIAKDSGYGIYSYSANNSLRYSQLLNRLASNLSGKAKVYSLIAPISAGIMLSNKTRDSIGCDDQNSAIEIMLSNMDDSIGKVNVHHTLKRHNTEYIFFRTDHHWTALGAYYSYREFCKVKGIEPEELSSYQTMEFKGFLGTFYQQSHRNPALGANPDTVTAYIPNDTNEMTCYMKQGDIFKEYNWKIIYDVSNYPQGEKYNCFAASDQAYNYVHNEKKTDGSSILVVKDSYGNAFIPFLVDHYEHIYWIDYRYYTAFVNWKGTGDSSVSALVNREGIKDVLILNNINFTGSNSTLNTFDRLYR
ncbi:MAG: hypothetical protein IK097_02430 [Clostridia bacterium]|nr:hypothetical protein [Clostridia bacterium]